MSKKVRRIGAAPPERSPVTFQPLTDRALREMTARQLDDHLQELVEINHELERYYRNGQDLLVIRADIEEADRRRREGTG